MTGYRKNSRVVREEPWMEYAACKNLDPEIFFPKKGHPAHTMKAKRVCAVCPVVQCCADYAIRNGFKDGVFGGMSEKERRPLRAAYLREQRATRAAS